jgi:hypothetical protein
MQKQTWKIIGASAVGTSHLAKEESCQDAFAYCKITQNESDILIIAVADGAGSAKNSLIGAETACNYFVCGARAWFESGQELQDLNKEFADNFLKQLQNQFAKKAQSENQSISDYACTFLGAIITTEAAAFFQIGDGAIVYAAVDVPDEYKIFALPQQGEYANTTHFVTSESAVETAEFEIVNREILEIAVFTDGLQRVVLNYKTQTPHAPFFRSMLAPLRGEQNTETLEKRLGEFLASPKINDRTDDDKTLVLAVRAILKL